MNAIELRQRAGELTEQARSIMDKATTEKRALSAEENAEVDKIHADVQTALTDAEKTESDKSAATERAAQQEALEKKLAARSAEPSREAIAKPGSPDAVLVEKRHKMFMTRLRLGLAGLDAEQRATLQQDNDIGGGFFAATEQFVNSVLKNADNVLAIRGLATVFQVTRGTTLGVPTLTGDVTAFAFGAAGELTEAVENAGIAFGKRELKPRDIRANVIKISRPLLESSKIDIQAFVTARAGYALANCLGAAYMTGDGAAGPLGLFTASADGVTTAQDVVSGSATGLTADGLINAMLAVPDAYQNTSRWLVSREFIGNVMKLKDGNQQYIWQPGLQNGTPNVLLGKPYSIDSHVPHVFTNGLYVGMYGDFSNYWIADATNLNIQRLVETYATTNQIGLLFRDMAADGMPVLAEAFARVKCSV
jgi:HK97 family phage major capsid protein